jgi:hypothetical protein
MQWPTDKRALLDLGIALAEKFCTLNGLEVPATIITPREEWHFGVCAYYRPTKGIKICLEKCQSPCTIAESRNWTWPASTTDREPYGVVGHEIGHHIDWTASDVKGSYYGDYSIKLRASSAEKPLTSYCPNDAEWFAEMARLFITNPCLLQALRPKTYELLLQRWIPLDHGDWLTALGTNVPPRVIRVLRNKVRSVLPTQSGKIAGDNE